MRPAQCRPLSAATRPRAKRAAAPRVGADQGVHDRPAFRAAAALADREVPRRDAPPLGGRECVLSVTRRWRCRMQIEVAVITAANVSDLGNYYSRIVKGHWEDLDEKKSFTSAQREIISRCGWLNIWNPQCVAV